MGLPRAFERTAEPVSDFGTRIAPSRVRGRWCVWGCSQIPHLGTTQHSDATENVSLAQVGRHFRGWAHPYRRVRKGIRGNAMKLAIFIAALCLPAAVFSQNGQIQQPKGNWQTPGQIQQPRGPWQTPGDIQVPKGIQDIHREKSKCEQRTVVGSDALFDFDKDQLNPDAEQTLAVLGPMLQQAANHPVTIQGYTDSIGTDTYNQGLSERRARSVVQWLVAHNYLKSGSAQVQGFGKKNPVAPNGNPDGSDNPLGRQKNRRVEIIIDTCH
jgi:outer membrane protein OmpA-like peptidoglycan-associated protein